MGYRTMILGFGGRVDRYDFEPKSVQEPWGKYIIQRINKLGFLERKTHEGSKSEIPKGFTIFKTIRKGRHGF